MPDLRRRFRSRTLWRQIASELPHRLQGKAFAQFLTSGDAEQAARIMSLLWGGNVAVRQLPQAFL